MADRVRIGSGDLIAEIDPLGAELQSLRWRGAELMWSGDPAVWSGRAPILFPIVGRLRDDSLRIDGTEYSMPKHGFARRSKFDVMASARDAANFVLTDSGATRAHYPFAFELTLDFAIDGAALRMRATLANPGATPLFASFGYHPAFTWPLPFGGARDAHRIAFEHDETALIRMLTPDGLIGGYRTSPVERGVMLLRDGLFEADALIWDRLTSRRVRYGAPGAAWLDVAFPDTDTLGIWTRPGADFVCIEPWAGMADPADFEGDFRGKPGIFEVAPGEARSFRMDVIVTS